MKLWEGTSEEFVIKKGWKKTNGYKIDISKIEDLADSWDYVYFAKEDMLDYLEQTEFWIHDDFEEVYEDVDLIIDEKYEEYIDDNKNLFDEPVNDPGNYRSQD